MDGQRDGGRVEASASLPVLCVPPGRVVIMVAIQGRGERSDYCLVGSQRYRSAQKYVVRERGTVSDIIYTPETAGAEAHTHNNTKYQPRDTHVHTQIQNTHRRRGLRILQHKYIYVNPLLETRAAKMHLKHTTTARGQENTPDTARKHTQYTNTNKPQKILKS